MPRNAVTVRAIVDELSRDGGRLGVWPQEKTVRLVAYIAALEVVSACAERVVASEGAAQQHALEALRAALAAVAARLAERA